MSIHEATIKIVVEVTPVDSDRPVDREEMESAVEGIRHALAYGQGEGFVHPRSEDVSVMVKSVSLDDPENDFPKPGGICFEFDKIMFKPVKVRFLGINETDGWMRFRYLETTSSVGEFTSQPVSQWNQMFFSSRRACLESMIERLLNQVR